MALIAEKHMAAHALATANRLLKSQPIDPALPRFCTSVGLDVMADSSTWADDLRKVRPETSAWHYIDIPRGAPRSAMAHTCPASTGCITGALEQQIALLRSNSTDPRARADSLRFVIHLVADVHQPLHCVTNNDKGGNCVPVEYFGTPPVEKNPQTGAYWPNLHSVWDYSILQRIRGMETVAQWAASLDRQFRPHAGDWEREGVNVQNWAWESHQLADELVYRDLPIPIPIERPEPVDRCSDDNHGSTRLFELHEQVGQTYVDAVAPTANEQIAKAGVRLAMVLNQIWP